MVFDDRGRAGVRRPHANIVQQSPPSIEAVFQFAGGLKVIWPFLVNPAVVLLDVFKVAQAVGRPAESTRKSDIRELPSSHARRAIQSDVDFAEFLGVADGHRFAGGSKGKVLRHSCGAVVKSVQPVGPLRCTDQNQLTGFEDELSPVNDVALLT